MIHANRKTLVDAGDKASSRREKTRLKTAITELEEALTSNETEEKIEEKTNALTQASLVLLAKRTERCMRSRSRRTQTLAEGEQANLRMMEV